MRHWNPGSLLVEVHKWHFWLVSDGLRWSGDLPVVISSFLLVFLLGNIQHQGWASSVLKSQTSEGVPGHSALKFYKHKVRIVEYWQKNIGIKTESPENFDRTGSLTWEVQVKGELLLVSLLFNISSLLVVFDKACISIYYCSYLQLGIWTNP